MIVRVRCIVRDEALDKDDKGAKQANEEKARAIGVGDDGAFETF